MDASSGSTRKSRTTEPDEDQERHESEGMRLVGGLDVSADTVDCMCSDVDMCGENECDDTA